MRACRPLRKRQSHWFESRSTSETAVPLVFGLTRRRDSSDEADSRDIATSSPNHEKLGRERQQNSMQQGKDLADGNKPLHSG